MGILSDLKNKIYNRSQHSEGYLEYQKRTKHENRFRDRYGTEKPDPDGDKNRISFQLKSRKDNNAEARREFFDSIPRRIQSDPEKNRQRFIAQYEGEKALRKISDRKKNISSWDSFKRKMKVVGTVSRISSELANRRPNNTYSRSGTFRPSVVGVSPYSPGSHPDDEIVRSSSSLSKLSSVFDNTNFFWERSSLTGSSFKWDLRSRKSHFRK